jgi:hypothetical protein
MRSSSVWIARGLHMGEGSMHLRLSGSSAPSRSAVVGAPRGGARADAAMRAAVEQEMRSASTLGPDDARRIVAARVVEALEGGRAAILRPEARRGVMTVARACGLRPFDANLVIAIVQDGARRGETVGTPDVESRLRLVGGGAIERRARRAVVARHVVVNLVAAVVLGVGVGAVLIAWLMGG